MLHYLIDTVGDFILDNGVNLRHILFNAGGLVCDKKSKKVFTVEKSWQKQWNGKIFYSHGTPSFRGVFIALRKNLEFKSLSPQICDPQGR